MALRNNVCLYYCYHKNVYIRVNSVLVFLKANLVFLLNPMETKMESMELIETDVSIPSYIKCLSILVQ